MAERWATSHRFRRRGLIALASAALALGTVSPVWAHTSDDVAAARADRDRAYARVTDIEDDLATALARYDRTHTALDEIEAKVARTEAGLDEYETQVRQLREKAKDAVIEAYVGGGLDEILTPVGTERFEDALMAMLIGERLRQRQRTELNQLSAVTRQVSRLRGRLDEEQVSAARLASEAMEASEDVAEMLGAAEHELAHAEEQYAGIKAQYEEEQRRRREAELARIRARSNPADRGLPATATDSLACPVQGGASFIDSWGFPRSGGRRHKGVDMFAARGTPTPAVTSGTVQMRTVNLGGIVAYVYGDDGRKYYYAHLNGYPDGLRNGQRVKRGQPIGFVGNSGNAEGTSPHLHFEIRPGGGSAVNPYPTVRSACP